MFISRACGARWTTNSSPSWFERFAGWVSSFPRMKTDGAVENNITGAPDAALRILAVYCSCFVRGIDFDISLAGLTTRNGSESGPRPGNCGELNCAYAKRLHSPEYGGSGRSSFARSLVGRRRPRLPERGSEGTVARAPGQKGRSK